MVYVLNQNGKALMPCTECKARHLLKEGKAVVVDNTPFTIRLKFAVSEHVEPVTLGVDAGYKTIGLSATTESRVLYECEVELRDDIVTLLTERRELRRSRRNRKIRYRAPRFNNRVRSKNKGWLAPSVEQRIGSHLQVIKEVCRILPVCEIVIETAAFDIQKIKNADIEGAEYQQGEQLGFWNVREYVLFRDKHLCQNPKCNCKDPVLNVHHILPRSKGGSNRPENLITLCETCHKAYHCGEISLVLMKHNGFKAEAFMSIARWETYNRLKVLYPNVRNTYGYLTKNTRIEHALEKEHYIDARCISAHPDAVSDGSVYYYKKIRSHNRKLHKNTILKGGIRKDNQCPRKIFDFALFDKVRYNEQVCYIHGRRASGSFDVRKPDGQVISHGVSYKKLMLVEHAGNYLRRRTSSSS